MRFFVCPAFVGKSAFSGNAFPDALYYGPHCTVGSVMRGRRQIDFSSGIGPSRGGETPPHHSIMRNPPLPVSPLWGIGVWG